MEGEPLQGIRYKFSRLLTVTQRRWAHYLDKRLAMLGLTDAKWHTLVEISKSQTTLNQRELADRLGIEPATLVKLLDGLAAKKLVRRVADGTDRRTKRIEITPAGSNVLGKISAVAEEIRNELLQDVSDKELRAAIAVLERVQAKFEHKSSAHS
jgi:MarR family transcriptional regulator for hemolysin